MEVNFKKSKKKKITVFKTDASSSTIFPKLEIELSSLTGRSCPFHQSLSWFNTVPNEVRYIACLRLYSENYLY